MYVCKLEKYLFYVTIGSFLPRLMSAKVVVVKQRVPLPPECIFFCTDKLL